MTHSTIQLLSLPEIYFVPSALPIQVTFNSLSSEEMISLRANMFFLKGTLSSIFLFYLYLYIYTHTHLFFTYTNTRLCLLPYLWSTSYRGSDLFTVLTCLWSVSALMSAQFWEQDLLFNLCSLCWLAGWLCSSTTKILGTVMHKQQLSFVKNVLVSSGGVRRRYVESGGHFPSTL